MKRSIVGAVLAILSIFSAADAQWPRGTHTIFSPFVKPLKIGGGGWNVMVAVANDGTRFTGTDTYGGFKFNTGTGLWEQYVTKTTMPAADFGYYPTTGTSQVQQQTTGGVYALAVLPTDSSKVYMIKDAKFFASTNGGATWTRPSPGLPTQPNDVNGPLDPNTDYRQSGPKMAVDPNNYLHVLVGTTINGLYETVDGGVNFTSVTAVPTSISWNGQYPAYNVAFDQSSAHNCGSGGIQTCVIYAYQNSASPSMYKSINGGTSWSNTTGGPTTMDRLVVSDAGTVWATDDAQGIGGNGGDVWKYASNTWTHVTGATAAQWFCGQTGGPDYCHAIAVDPVTPSRILFFNPRGDAFVSLNTGGSTTATTKTIVGTDVPWLPITGGINYMAVGDVVWDRSVPGQLIMGMGLGTFTSIVPDTGNAVWTSLNAGQEQLVTAAGIAPNGIAITGNEDRGTFTLNSPNTYPSIQNTPFINSMLSLFVTYGLDYAAGNTNFMAALITASAGNAGNNSATSSDGGQTWNLFSSYNKAVAGNNAACSSGSGPVNITVPNTTGLTTWAFNSTTGSSGSIARVYGSYVQGKNATSAYWPITVLNSTTIQLQGSACSNFILGDAAYSFQIVVETQPLSNRNGGFNVTGVANNGSGLIRVTFTSTSQDLIDQTYICLSGILGTTEANGCWTFNVVNTNSNQMDLIGSTFTHTYTSGGVGKYRIPNGGTIAVADANNMVVVPANDVYPICTTDGGQTWTEKTSPTVATGSLSGWGHALYLFAHPFVADRVTANTFYGYNYVAGVYKMTGCGTMSIVSGSQLNSGIAGYTANTATAGLFPNGDGSSTLKSVPGYAGHLFFATGFVGSATHPVPRFLYRSIDGGQNWFNIYRTSEPQRFDCSGAIAPGMDYPTCYMVGWIDNDYGTWRATGTAAQWATCTGSGTSQVCGTTVTWTKLVDYPLGSMDGPQVIVADGVTWNKWYQGFGGSGWAYGQQN